ncbi:osteopontin [Anarrhichthys ocellatus]|uniref:osteopontin n=1 Tax=Anarrhichthys ocellatus TaxID=433405 RepID=UPI0012EEC42E|nr:osteopontin-like [Anarrhichthys ocellatus]
MKVAVVFVLLFATVLCRPARKVADSSSESSEEVARRPAAQPLGRKAAEVPEYRAAPVQNVEEAAAAAGSDESAEGSDEDEQAAAEALVELKSASTDTTSSPDTTSVDSQDSEDSDDDDADDDDAEDSETEEDEDSESSESGESSSPAPTTVSPVIVTEEPVAEATAEPILPTIVTDMETARGDSLGGYPSDYKSIVYVEDKSYHKGPGPYKSYEFVGTGKKMAYDMTEGNEVDKSLKVYKAFQVRNDLLEEDTSTPEMESQGLDAASIISQNQDLSPRQASLPKEEESASTSDATTSESSSAPEEEEEQSDSTASASTSQESEDEDSQSSEEATATPGAADSESDESAENDEVAAPDATTDMPEVLTAK